MRFLSMAAIAASLLAAGVFAGTASADSIVYAKDGNLFLTSPDGAKGYQLTGDGGYSSPSQARDGTIGAVHDGQLVRMDRSGRQIGAAVDAIGSPGSVPGIAGPYDARLSPDGRRFAYWFYVQTSYHVPYDPEHRIVLDTGSWTTWTWADRFTDPVAEAGFQKGMSQPDWLSNDRVVGTEGFWMNMWTWKVGTAADSAQYWFGLQDPPDQYGVPAYHWYDDPSLSPNGAKLAMTDGGKALMLASQSGPAWVGEPPYAIDYLNGTTPVSAPSLQCRGDDGVAANPSWSSDSRQLAYGAADGVRVLDVPDSLDCGAVTERTVAPGGHDPAFGPADVDMADAPRGATGPTGGNTGPTTGGGGGAAAVSRISLRPRTFRAGGRTTLRFTLSAPARVTIARRGARRAVSGHAGVNRVRLTARGLKPGRYRLSLTPAGGRTRTTTFRVVAR